MATSWRRLRRQVGTPAQPAPSTYTVEFKEPVGWDRRFLYPHVMIHEVPSDGLLRLLTDFHGGHLDLDPNLEFVAPEASVVVRLVHIDPILHNAVLRVWKLPANGIRAIRIDSVNANPPGDDAEGEYVVIQNDTSTPTNVLNWTLRDAANHVFKFPSYVLLPGFDVKVWTGVGTNDAENLFWGHHEGIWNNTGDTAILRDQNGTEVASYAY